MIFKDTAQRLKFAFSYCDTDDINGSKALRVIIALHSAGMTSTGMLAEGVHQSLADDARAVLDEVASIQQHESAALIATYSHQWEQRRAAADQLRDHYRPILSRVIDDRHLLSKLVARHYIAERERGSSWSLPAIAREFKIEHERLKRAADLIDQHAKTLERAALQSLEARLAKLEIAHA